MIYKEHSDITKVKIGTIAHGVNCRKVMGSGVAKALYTKWPKIKESFLKVHNPILGKVQRVDVGPYLTVFNCFTQEDSGLEDKKYASPEAIRQCFTTICEYFPIEEINIPKIGSGLGGLLWEEEVVPVLRDIEEKYNMSFVVHSL